MEVRCAELQDDRELLEATPIGELYLAPAHMITDNSALVTVAEEQRGCLPARGSPRDICTTEADNFTLCSTDEGSSCCLVSDGHGLCAEVWFTAEHWVLDFDRATTMRPRVTAAAKRAAVVKEDDLLAKADTQANPVKVSK
eukprot:9282808-Pyramimonas_sp.AAC.1